MRCRALLFCVGLMGLMGCQEEEPVPVMWPRVSTLGATEITHNSALVGGEILDPGTEPIIQRGVCFREMLSNSQSEFENIAINIDTTVGNRVVLATSEEAIFKIVIDNLNSNKTYALRAFAKNDVGIAYGYKIKFTTIFDTITDIDGNVYRVLKIGDQTWTIDNYNATHFRDGTPIPIRTEDSYWVQSAPQEPAMCWYDNDRETYENDYGALYNWYAASHPLIAPEGWRVPTEEDYLKLRFYLQGGDQSIQTGGKMKMVGYDFWLEPNSGATNSSGFSAKGAGARGINNVTNELEFLELKKVAYFHCYNDYFGNIYLPSLMYNLPSFITGVTSNKGNGNSIRLIKID